jgi:hypothetical protein
MVKMPSEKWYREKTPDARWRLPVIHGFVVMAQKTLYRCGSYPENGPLREFRRFGRRGLTKG